MTTQEAIQEALLGRRPASVSEPEELGAAFLAEVLRTYGTGDLQHAVVSKAARILAPLAEDRWNVVRAQGVAEMFSGRWAAAATAFHRAGTVAPSDLGPVVRIAEIDCLARSGDLEGAIRLGKRIVRQLSDNLPQQARARINLGNALEQADQLKASAKQYRQALQDLGEQYPQDRLKALIGLAWSSAMAGDFAEAEQAATEAFEGFTELGHSSSAALAAGTLGLTLLARGRADAGLQLLVQHIDNIPAAQRGWAYMVYGDCLNALNLWEDAEVAYRRTLQSQAPIAIAANAHLGRANAQHHLEDESASIRHLALARRAYTRMGNEVMLGWCSLLEAKHSSGAARVNHAEKAHSILSRAGWKALAEEALVLARPTDQDQLRRLVRRGNKQVRWRAAFALASISDGPERVRWQERMIREILMARVELQSTYARVSYLADKTAALSEAIMEWLASPNRRLWTKARRAILETRSVTLIDEIAGSLSAPQQSVLFELRSQISVGGDGEMLPPTLRRGVGYPSLHPQTSHRAETVLDQIVHERNQSDAHILVAGPSGMAWIFPDGSRQILDVSYDMLRHCIDRVQFELFSPLVGFEGEADVCVRALKELSKRIQLPPAPRLLISPEGAAWDIPWQLLSLVGETPSETTLTLCPALAGRPPVLTEAGRVVLWAAAQDALPHIQREVDAFMAQHPGCLVCRTRQEALQSLAEGTISLLHVSAHGRHIPNNPMFSDIQFVDGALTAFEIANSAARIDHAVLMSCESARVTPTQRAEPDGLIRAFLARGSSTAIGSSWLLDDETAFHFQNHFYGAYSTGCGFEQSLTLARHALRQAKPHPFYWGAPVLFRGYSVLGEVRAWGTREQRLQ